MFTISAVNETLKAIAKLTEKTRAVARDLLLLQFTIVNVCIVSIPDRSSKSWFLVDTGLPGSAGFIRMTLEKHFGKAVPPKAIILTHGHFDHVGSVMELAEEWKVPVYAHSLEIPYITGRKSYPEADPSVDEGMVAKMSPAFPHQGINLGYHAVELPSDGSIPGMSGWKWIHTPGHTQGHICLYREKDRVLLAADALATVKQESLLSVLLQKEKISGPPKYLTTDWQAAEESVRKIRELEPSLIIPSHGQPMKGEELRKHLDFLVDNFKELAVPDQGRFVDK